MIVERDTSTRSNGLQITTDVKKMFHLDELVWIKGVDTKQQVMELPVIHSACLVKE